MHAKIRKKQRYYFMNWSNSAWKTSDYSPELPKSQTTDKPKAPRETQNTDNYTTAYTWQTNHPALSMSKISKLKMILRPTFQN